MHAAGEVSVSRVVMARLSKLKVDAVAVLTPAAVPEEHAAESSDETADQLETALAELVEFAASADPHPRLTRQVADAEWLRAMLALRRGDPVTAEQLLNHAVDLLRSVEHHAYAVEPAILLAQLRANSGAPDSAARLLTEVLERAGDDVEPEVAGGAHLLLADIAQHTGRYEAAAQHALTSVLHWDTAGDLASAARARLTLAMAYLALERFDEAATIAEAALPDLSADDDEAIVQVRQILGTSLQRLGEPLAAAEHFLQAADIAQHWPHQLAHAGLASSAAEALHAAGMLDHADQAYRRAAELWQKLGEVVPLVRTLRARAWVAIGSGSHVLGPEAVGQALSLMTEAEQRLRSALTAEDGGDHPSTYQQELAETHLQAARIHWQAGTSQADDGAPDERRMTFLRTASDLASRAETGFAACGREAFAERVTAAITAARVEITLGRPDQAKARLQVMIATCRELGELDQLARCEALLEQM
jgi:tetratricopeptide (TPR) repeat protein